MYSVYREVMNEELITDAVNIVFTSTSTIPAIPFI